MSQSSIQRVLEITETMLEEKDQQHSRIMEEFERKDREISETKTELKVTLRVLENAVDREVELKMKLRDTESIISEKEKTIETLEKTIQEQDILIQKYKDKEQLLSDQKFCRICCKEEIRVLYIPCGHLYSCRDCASKFDRCPVCREDIKKLQSAFLP